jgi:hypothetical protein
MNKLVYKHKVTNEKIEIYKLTPMMWFKKDGNRRIFLRKKDLQGFDFIKEESEVRQGRKKTVSQRIT